MDELPRDAKALLALAKDAHGPPDPRARDRVHAKLLAAVAIAPASLPANAAQLTPANAGAVPAWFGSSKAALTGGLMLLALGGGVWSSLHRPSTSKVEQPAVEQPAQATPASQEPAPGAGSPPVSGEVAANAMAAEVTPLGRTAPSGPSTQAAHAEPRARTRHAADSAAAGPSLKLEVALLARAAEQLERGDAEAALRSLAEHQRRFAHTQLAQERDGLVLIAHCQQQRAHAPQAARRFLARSPAAVLVARVEQACAL